MVRSDIAKEIFIWIIHNSYYTREQGQSSVQVTGFICYICMVMSLLVPVVPVSPLIILSVLTVAIDLYVPMSATLEAGEQCDTGVFSYECSLRFCITCLLMVFAL